MKKNELINPFEGVKSDKMNPEMINQLYVDTYSEFPNINNDSNVIIKGPRGTGKTMMLSYMMPECQMLSRNTTFNQLDYFGAYIPLKKNLSSWSISERVLLKSNYYSNILNSHLLSTFACTMIFSTLNELCQKNIINISTVKEELNKYIKHVLSEVLFDVYLTDTIDNKLKSMAIDNNIFQTLKNESQNLHRQGLLFLKTLTDILATTGKLDIYTYNGPCCTFDNFVIPLVEGLVDLPGFPKKIFLLFDDADILNDSLITILNTWISTRISQKLSLKVATIYHKHYYNVFGDVIQDPHDFSEVDLTNIYSNSKSKQSNYYRTIERIVSKRLVAAGIKTKPSDFFPEDKNQVLQIKQIEQELKENSKIHEEEIKGTDKNIQNARPKYIQQIKKGQYSYSGFEQIVNLSSGITRYFLEYAFEMFNEAISSYSEEDQIELNYIEPNIQTRIVRKQADEFYSDLKSKSREPDKQIASKVSEDELSKIGRLITNLGTLFYHILRTNRYDRQVTSFALTEEDTLKEPYKSILHKATILNYLICSRITHQTPSLGRATRYQLCKLLAPIWDLDITIISKNIHKNNDFIIDAMTFDNPDKFAEKHLPKTDILTDKYTLLNASTDEGEKNE